MRSATRPCQVIDEVPSAPAARFNPVVPDNLTVPFVAASCTSMREEPASTSLTDTRLPWAPENSSVVFSSRDCATGAVRIGASLTAAMLSVVPADELRVPSDTVVVSVREPLASGAVT